MGNRQQPADRLDPEYWAVFVDEREHFDISVGDHET
jgi:hypothetical protein